MTSQRQTARVLRETGVTYRQIAAQLDVSYSTVYRWINPDVAARSRAAAKAWKGRNRHANRARDRAYSRSPRRRGVCANPVCGQPKGTNGVKHGMCRSCWAAVADVRRTLVEGMWADDWSIRDITAALGVTSSMIGPCRARGWDLPHRYRPRTAIPPLEHEQELAVVA